MQLIPSSFGRPSPDRFTEHGDPDRPGTYPHKKTLRTKDDFERADKEDEERAKAYVPKPGDKDYDHSKESYEDRQAARERESYEWQTQWMISKYGPPEKGGRWWRETDEQGQENEYHRTVGFSKFQQTMSGPFPEEYSAMMGYMDRGYAEANAALRAGQTHRFVEPLDRIIGRNTIDQDATVFRTIGEHVLQGLKVGDVFRDDAYSSTTWDRKVADRIVEAEQKRGNKRPKHVVEIALEAGQHALEVEQYEGGDELRTISEKEYLLPRGMRFVVVAVDERGRVTKVKAIRS